MLVVLRQIRLLKNDCPDSLCASSTWEPLKFVSDIPIFIYSTEGIMSVSWIVSVVLTRFSGTAEKRIRRKPSKFGSLGRLLLRFVTLHGRSGIPSSALFSMTDNTG